MLLQLRRERRLRVRDSSVKLQSRLVAIIDVTSIPVEMNDGALLAKQRAYRAAEDGFRCAGCDGGRAFSSWRAFIHGRSIIGDKRDCPLAHPATNL